MSLGGVVQKGRRERVLGKGEKEKHPGCGGGREDITPRNEGTCEGQGGRLSLFTGNVFPAHTKSTLQYSHLLI